ncbi:MAG TPA: hypothetical protein VEZ90_10730 [Blastocatellia bacterium]|nr:hypothetical protein [Blastocatellia bacterium]
MLRIEIRRNEDLTTGFVLAGKLVGPWVQEFEKCWRTADKLARGITVDLTAVSFIDTRGKELLARMLRDGAKLVAAGCHIKALVREIEATVGAGDASTN